MPCVGSKHASYSRFVILVKVLFLGKHCIRTCINNLWKATVSVGENSPSAVLLDVDLAEQLLCVLRFINNTSEVTQLLLDDFRQHQGYVFIVEFVLK